MSVAKIEPSGNGCNTSMDDKEFAETLFDRPIEEINMREDADWRGLKEVIEKMIEEKA